MKKKKDKRVFSIFKVYDYKGGELSATTNVSFNNVVGELIEAGVMDHDKLEYADDIYNFSDKEIKTICNESEIKDTLYAGGDDTVIRVYEHKKKKVLTEVELEYFKPFFADYIIGNK